MILPTQEHGISLHLFMPSLISFKERNIYLYTVINFSVQFFFVSLGNLIRIYFLLLPIIIIIIIIIITTTTTIILQW